MDQRGKHPLAMDVYLLHDMFGLFFFLLFLKLLLYVLME